MKNDERVLLERYSKKSKILAEIFEIFKNGSEIDQSIKFKSTGLQGLRSNLGGDAASIVLHLRTVNLYCVYTIQLVTSSLFVQCVHCIT